MSDHHWPWEGASRAQAQPHLEAMPRHEIDPDDCDHDPKRNAEAIILLVLAVAALVGIAYGH